MSDKHIHKGSLSITFDGREVHSSTDEQVQSDATVEAITGGLNYIFSDQSNTLHRIVMRTICDECGQGTALITVEGNHEVLADGFEKFKAALNVATPPLEAYFIMIALPIVEHAAMRANSNRLKQVMERIFPGQQIRVVRVVRD